jgi:hypothetical protein
MLTMLTMLTLLQQVKLPPGRTRLPSPIVSRFIIIPCALAVLATGLIGSLWLPQLQRPQVLVTNGADC